MISPMQNIPKILVALAIALLLCLNNATMVSAHDYGKQGAAEAAPSATLTQKGNSYQQKTDYSSDRQKDYKQDRSFKQQESSDRQTQTSSYQQDQSPKQETTYQQQDSGQNKTQKEQ
ncbi:hypothetical protein TUMEXPCC7403_16145 [Tumidithrix helvetica PCC 7403]|uniref:hypothetical protein n=1 Tax=Tumidithrix helvetica TaxID=3457545 RepID=UPI003CB1F2E6